MKKEYVHNVILVMSGGVGARFGTDCPKQYNIMDNRMVIDYVIDACRKTKAVDEIVIVANEGWVDFIHDRYNIPTVPGGDTRPESVLHGIQYVHEHYDCDKLIITNAVCPLATSDQYDKYFQYLDEYDFVLTNWKLAPALQRFDGVRVDRDEFFNVMEPDAYRFKMLWGNYDFKNLKKYIFHNMPLDAKAYYCFDYPYTYKLTYWFDLKVLKVLYDEIVANPEKEHTMQALNSYLGGDKATTDWILNVQKTIKELANKYALTSYTLNSLAQANVVYNAVSQTLGDIVIKFHPNHYFFNKEYTYYSLASKDSMAELLDYSAEDNYIVLKEIKPGLQVHFHAENRALRAFFDQVDASLVPANKIPESIDIPYFMDEFDDFADQANQYTWELDLRKQLSKQAHAIYDRYFKDSPMYFLHGDLQRRNLLSNGDNILAIDPRGTIAPREFEYMIMFMTELRENTEQFDSLLYDAMFEFFAKYVDKQRLNAALFVFWVHKLNDYTFHKHDDFKLASWVKECIFRLYFEGEDPSGKAIEPKGV